MERKLSKKSIVKSRLIAFLVILALLLNFGTVGVFANTNSIYWTNAQQTHNFTVGNLLTPSNSYRSAVGASITTEWYNVSQIYADSSMIRYGDSRYLPFMNNTFAFMSKMWDVNSTIGGYFAQSNADGTGAAGDKFVDDNALAGNAYLDAYEVTTGTDKTNYLNSAQKCANWLMNCGLWDNTFNGGFWWTTNKTDAVSQVKATEVNALACQLFVRLYIITGSVYYKQWADSVRTWLYNNLYDSSKNLFDWQYEKSSGTINKAIFTYDNAMMIEVNLLYYQLTSDTTYLVASQSIANAMINPNNNIWYTPDITSGVFLINTNDLTINPCYSGWASQSLIKLYQVDGNTKWLDYAQKNIDYINKSPIINTSNKGYYWKWDPVNKTFPSGQSPDSQSLTEVSQAWMQKIQTMMAQYR